MHSGELEYLDALGDLVDIYQELGPDEDRTGTGTVSMFAPQMHFDLSEGFPLLTTKRVYWHGVIEELFWFLRGETNVASLQARGVRIWDEWADKNGNLGPIYGAQWRNWGGYTDGDEFGIDQIQDLIKGIKRNPHSRRHIVNAWNVTELDDMRLPPCHMMFQCYVRNGELSMQVYQRSADIFLGVPFNIASYAALTHIIAHVCELVPKCLTMTFGDLHLYANHIEQAKEQLSRNPLKAPKLEVIGPRHIDKLESLNIHLLDYAPHPTIKAEVSV